MTTGTDPDVGMRDTTCPCRVVRVAGQRIAGTLVGGGIGLVVRWVSVIVPGSYLSLLFAVTAAAMGVTGIWLSELMPSEGTTAQLFVVTFVMVFAEGHSMVRSSGLHSYAFAWLVSDILRLQFTMPVIAAASHACTGCVQQDSLMIFTGRTGGIVVGILLSLVFTILVLPSSAHNEVDGKLADALRGLRRLNGLIWHPLSSTSVLAPSGAKGGGGAEAHGSDAQQLIRQIQAAVGDESKASSEDVADEVRPVAKLRLSATCRTVKVLCACSFDGMHAFAGPDADARM